MKHNDLKESYRGLVNKLKEEGKRKGAKITNEFIAESLGYERSYFSTLLGERGNVTEDHIKTFKLHFPTVTQQKLPEADPPPGNTQLAALIDANCKLAESVLITARNTENLTEANRELAAKITVNAPSQNDQDVIAMRSVVLELLSEIGSGKRYKSPDEVKAVYRKGIADALQLGGAKDTQTHSGKLHTGKRSS